MDAKELIKRIIAEYATERTTIERVEMVCPREAATALFDALAVEGGWRCTRSGPYTDASMFPKVDVTRSKFTLEREVPAPAAKEQADEE